MGTSESLSSSLPSEGSAAPKEFRRRVDDRGGSGLLHPLAKVAFLAGGGGGDKGAAPKLEVGDPGAHVLQGLLVCVAQAQRDQVLVFLSERGEG